MKLIREGGQSDFNNFLKMGFDPETQHWPDWFNNLVPIDILPNLVATFLATCPLEEDNTITPIGSTLAIKLLSHKRINNPEIGLYAHQLADI